MAERTKKELPATGDEKKAARKPYKKPTFRHERVFETMALTCGKMSSTEDQCRFIQKIS